MKKPNVDLKKLKKGIDNPLINKSELARVLGISSGLFSDKKNNKNNARFTDEQQIKINQVFKKLANSLSPSPLK